MSTSQKHPEDDDAGLTVQVNGEAVRLSAGATLADLVAELSLREKKIAVAVNRKVEPRAAHAEIVLAPGDRVEILEAVGGG